VSFEFCPRPPTLTRRKNAGERDRPSQKFCASGNHEFWPADFSIRDLRSVNGHALANKQITEVYLLALARYRNGRLATFDRSIPLDGVDGATSRHLAIIPA
jgi:uncharacterized protein